MNATKFQTKHIFVADDDPEDHILFQEVIKDLPYLVYLTTAHDGEEAITVLNGLNELPDVMFLDLEMPINNGFECLKEMKKNKKLQSVPVIVFSTSSYPGAVNQCYNDGAHLYIRKPDDFINFKKCIHFVLAINWKSKLTQPPREEFVLNLFGDKL